MYFKQLVKEDLGCASYLVGCTNAAMCAVVDPRLDMVQDILELVAAQSMRVTAVIETHLHADHLSGHRELARRTGARIYVHALARPVPPSALSANIIRQSPLAHAPLSSLIWSATSRHVLRI